jgi:hypothetical protein
MKTLSSGIYYEFLPESVVQVSLFHRLKQVFDGFMQPSTQGLEQSLKVSDAIDVLIGETVSPERAAVAAKVGLIPGGGAVQYLVRLR